MRILETAQSSSNEPEEKPIENEVEAPVIIANDAAWEKIESYDEEFEQLHDNYRKTLYEKSEMEFEQLKLEDDIEKKNKKIRQLTRELSYSIEAGRPGAEIARHVIEALYGEISDKEHEVNEMKEQHKASQEKLRILVDRGYRLAKEINEYKSTISNLQTINETLRQSNTALVQEIVANTNQISERNETLSEVEKELASSQEKIRLLEHKLGEKACKLEEIETDLTVKSMQVAALQTDLNVLGHELDEVKKTSNRNLNLIEPRKVKLGYIAAAVALGMYGLKKVISSF